METKDTLEKMYEDLRSAGVVHNKKDLAELVGTKYTTLVAAMTGSRPSAPIYAKVVRIWKDATGEAAPMPQPEPVDPMLARVDAAHQIAMKAQEQTDRLLTMLEFQMGMAETTPVRLVKKDDDRLTDKQ